MKNIIPYGTQNIDKTDINEVVETLKSDYLTQGPKIKKFEKAVADYHNCKYAVAFSNGTAALHGAYFASGLQKGDEFITSPLTFAASSNGGLYLGGIPRFVDINPNSYNIDLLQLEEKISKKTKIITPVSYAGFPVNLEKISKISKKHNIKIIHDAAHAIGAKKDGKNIIDYADMTILSFHPVKHVATGEGGMVLTNNKKYYEKLKEFRTHGITKDPEKLDKNPGDWYYEMQSLGYNYRMTDIQASLGITQMKKLNKSIYKRNLIAKKYEEELANLSWLDLPTNKFKKDWLKDKSFENLNKKPKNLNSYHLFPVLLKDPKDRKPFFDYMRKNKIWVQVHYIPVHTMPYYKKKFGFKKGDFPNAERFYQKEVSIPMYPSITNSQLTYVIDTIKNFKN
ncbi:MAG: UDP-4-amino-4,6-dideoxy-N-acetyl-beta-L-altrosamine transaminase [Fusobacteriota bacterium]